jgi:uncharacterized protein YecE (DUF72 family)
MKFGTPSTSELDDLDLSLPPDHPSNSNLQGKQNPIPKVYIGCSAWNMDEWVGGVYPEGTKKKDYLAEYIRRFNSVELNSTFYNIKKANMQAWAEAVKETDFKFCPKFNRRISHIKRLKDEVFEITDYFVEMCLSFGDNLGMAFLQMPENFGPKWFNRLREFLERLPVDFPMAVELRHEDWFQGNEFDETFDLLRSLNKTVIITDTALKRNIIHQRFTNDKVFIRFSGYDDHPSNNHRLDDWSERLGKWIKLGISEVYFFTKHEDERFSQYTSDHLIKKMNEVTGAELRSPFDPL